MNTITSHLKSYGFYQDTSNFDFDTELAQEIALAKKLPPLPDSLFLHMHGDSFGRNSGLEGFYPDKAMDYLKDTLKVLPSTRNCKKSSRLESVLANAIYLHRTFFQSSKSAPTLNELHSFKEALEQQLAKDEVLLSLEWSNHREEEKSITHSVKINIIPNKDKTCIVRVFNTGYGAITDDKSTNFKKCYHKYIQLPCVDYSKVLQVDFLRALLEIGRVRWTEDQKKNKRNYTLLGGSDFYFALLSMLDSQIEGSKILIKGQRSGTCVWEGLMAWWSTKRQQKSYSKWKMELKKITSIKFFNNILDSGPLHEYDGWVGWRRRLHLFAKAIDKLALSTLKESKREVIDLKEKEKIKFMLSYMAGCLDKQIERAAWIENGDDYRKGISGWAINFLHFLNLGKTIENERFCFLNRIEKAESIYIRSRESNTLEFHLPKLNLTFHQRLRLLCTPNFACEQFPGYHIPENQEVAELKGFNSFLLLQNSKGEKKIIIPHCHIKNYSGSLSPLNNLEEQEHVSEKMGKGDSEETNEIKSHELPPFFSYDLDGTGDIGSCSNAAKLYLILLFLGMQKYQSAAKYILNWKNSYIPKKESDSLIGRMVYNGIFTKDYSIAAIVLRLQVRYILHYHKHDLTNVMHQQLAFDLSYYHKHNTEQLPYDLTPKEIEFLRWECCPHDSSPAEKPRAALFPALKKYYGKRLKDNQLYSRPGKWVFSYFSKLYAIARTGKNSQKICLRNRARFFLNDPRDKIRQAGEILLRVTLSPMDYPKPHSVRLLIRQNNQAGFEALFKRTELH